MCSCVKCMRVSGNFSLTLSIFFSFICCKKEKGHKMLAFWSRKSVKSWGIFACLIAGNPDSVLSEKHLEVLLGFQG